MIGSETNTRPSRSKLGWAFFALCVYVAFAGIKIDIQHEVEIMEVKVELKPSYGSDFNIHMR